MPRKKKPFSRSEALDLLSKHLRAPEVPANVLVRLVALYSKLSNWKACPEPEDDDINKIVLAAERKRKVQTQ